MAGNRQPLLYGVNIATFLLATICVWSRIIFRINKRLFILADWFLATAWFFALLHAILELLATAKYGYGRHEADLPSELRNSHWALLCFWLSQILTKPPLLFAKLSVCLVYARVFDGLTSRKASISRAVNFINAGVIIAYYVASFVATIMECNPIQKAWIPKTPGTCINTRALFYSTGALNFVTSLVIVLNPLPSFFLISESMEHTNSRRGQLIALVLLGLVDTCISALRMGTLNRAAASKLDTSWTVVYSSVATQAEINLCITAASLLVMRPVFVEFRRCLRRAGLWTLRTTTDLTRPGYLRTANPEEGPLKNSEAFELSNKAEGANGITKTISYTVEGVYKESDSISSGEGPDKKMQAELDKHFIRKSTSRERIIPPNVR